MSQLEDLKRRLAAGRIDRRTFLQLAGAAGISTTAIASGVGGLLLPASARAATGKRGGRMRLGLGGGSTTDSLDPATFEDAFMQHMGSNFRNNLTEVAPDGTLTGELAAEWEAVDGGAGWVFRLREGVEFHNGKSLTAEDVIASLNHHRGEDTRSAAKSLLDAVTDIRADGPLTVVVELAEPNADFPFLMSDYHLGIMPATDGRVDPSDGQGTAGYIIESYDPGVRATLRRNPNYFKEGRAWFDEVEIIGIADPAARQNAIITGTVDAINRVDRRTVHLLQRQPGVVIMEATGTQHYTFPMITTQAPFDDMNVRLALKYGVRRDQMVQAVLRGHGTVGNDHPIAATQQFHADLPQREYDPERARHHLREAGLSSLDVDLSAADAAFAGAVDAAVLFQESAREAGINLNVVREPNDGYWSNVWMRKPFAACYWSGRPTADWMFSTAYAADSSWNDTFWIHERFNALLIQARGELDENLRAEMYYEMQEILSNEGGVIVPMFANYIDARSDKVGTPEQLASNWEMDGHRAMERWWFA